MRIYINHYKKVKINMTLKEIFSLKREFAIKGTKTYFFDMCLVIKNKFEFQDKSITKISNSKTNTKR